MKALLPWLAFGVLVLVGCGNRSSTGALPPDFQAVKNKNFTEPAHKEQETEHAGGMMVAMGDVSLRRLDVDMPPAGQVGGGKGGEAKPAPDEKLPRKIVYTADLRVIVEDFPTADAELKKLVKDHHGLI